MRFKHTHSSGYYKASPESLHKAMVKYCEDADIITVTEVATPKRVAALHVPGFGVLKTHNSLKDDSSIIYRNSCFKVIHHEGFLVGTHVFKLGGHMSSRLWAQIAVLEQKSTGKRVVVAVCHFPSGVEGDLAHNHITDRVIAWNEATGKLRKRVNVLKRQHKAKAAILSADWNINFKNRWARAAVKIKFPMWDLVWSMVRLPKRGTHGSRLIDAATLKGLRVFEAWVEADDNSSDHGPWSERLDFTT